MKKILQIIESSETGGAENVFVDLTSRLNANNYKVLIGLFEPGWLLSQLEAKGYRPELLTTKGSFDAALIKRLVTFIKKQKIDLVHAHLFGTSVYACIAAKIIGVPVVCTLHGTMDVGKNEKFRALKFWIINNFATKLVFVSESLKDYFMKMGLGRKKSAVVINNGIDVTRFHPDITRSIRHELGYSDEDILICAIGDIRPQKGYDILMKAAEVLHQQIPRMKFLFVGSETSFSKILKTNRDQLGLQDVVNFAGFRDDIPDILNSIDLYVLPSLSEGFSLTTIEAMAVGKPVIATRSGGPEKIITDGHDGILIDKSSSEAIVGAVQLLISNPGIASGLGQNALKNVYKKYSVNSMIKGYENLYQEIL